ncbi:class I SAM-dependent methyltransferase [Paenibacillus albiflavus]|uniref:Class I SAM-dependent methyltransferase n=1 Tax=Paenibacillus albiflavus TaxID=2545760 RepID=A0A4R4ELE2_9BACL|nr:class I SAM-dependent methyltransferase [Paenibacillus albiflavus]TCZ79271.1 class I SAM-dependent methyltransferase [Paenibacillus albiflavus]
MESIVQYYEIVDEELRFKRNSRKIEFITSIYALTALIPEKSKILDLGAGTGVYSFHFAEQGHKVTALDLTPRNIEAIHTKIMHQEGIQLEAVVGDATDLTRFDSGTFDVVLCFGPYYHIIDSDRQTKLIEESLRVLREGGILAIAYINKFSVVPMLAKKIPEYLTKSTINKVISDGNLKGNDPDSFWIDSHYTSPAEVESLMNAYPIRMIDHLGTDGLSHTLSEEIDKLSEEQYQTWMEYHLSTCREASILGISSHGLYICFKL